MKKSKSIYLVVVGAGVLTACDDGTSYKESAMRASYKNPISCEKQWGKANCRNEGGVYYSPYFITSSTSTSSSSSSSSKPLLYYKYGADGKPVQDLTRAPKTAANVPSSIVKSAPITRNIAPSSVSRGGFGSSSASAGG